MGSEETMAPSSMYPEERLRIQVNALRAELEAAHNSIHNLEETCGLNGVCPGADVCRYAASPAILDETVTPDGELYTTRRYPCGCRAEGTGDVPNYCSEHGKFVPSDPVNILIDALKNPANEAESTKVAHEIGAAVAAETTKPRVPDHSVLGAPYDLKNATVEHGIQVREGLWDIVAETPNSGVCNMCGAHHSTENPFTPDAPVNLVQVCPTCATEICQRCQPNHEFGCKQMAAKKARKLGPTVRNTVNPPNRG